MTRKFEELPEPLAEMHGWLITNGYVDRGEGDKNIRWYSDTNVSVILDLDSKFPSHRVYSTVAHKKLVKLTINFYTGVEEMEQAIEYLKKQTKILKTIYENV